MLTVTNNFNQINFMLLSHCRNTTFVKLALLGILLWAPVSESIKRTNLNSLGLLNTVHRLYANF